MAKLLSLVGNVTHGLCISYHFSVSSCRTMATNSSPGHVLLGGGTGFIGSAFTYLLKSKGYEVTIISRVPGPQRLTWFDIQSNGLPQGVTAVVNLSGQNILDPLQRWTPGFKQNVFNSRVNTTHNLAQAIVKAQTKPKVFVCISGVGIYKPDATVDYDEDSTLGPPFDFLSDLAQKWEEASLMPDTDVRRVIVRSGVVLGRSGGMIQQLFLPFFMGVGGPVASGTQYMPWIHIEDMCNLLLFAIENEKVTGVLNGVAPMIVTNQEFTTAFAQAMWRPSLIPLPEFIVNTMFGEERAKIMTQGQKVVPKRVLDYKFQYKYPDIISACTQVARLFYKTPF
ncbi:epimerase family protein SDR39U1-like [Macrosteles quadrilineatus]|uniref:epimerase family protein SDR39U1-like n=1 Tax=Macrosteles quadrilineatus TaxID=74068 RepID=UPI0023E2CF8B|nr:epimerase family protein SDR39U1-like [Macrosteles quadrilineatus]XP_054287309.1 epimerase family protein SDR39U1-like [Macrosteles quadrilineatus]